MEIESINIFRISMPLIYPFRTAFGDDKFIESVLVEMPSNGVSGWGEASPWSGPEYSPECASTLFIIARDFMAPQLIGKDIKSGSDLQRILSSIKGNYFAKASFDLAWWDLYAKILKEPLWKVIGGKNMVVPVGADFGVMENIDMLIKEIGNAVSKGFKRIKLKYRPGWDLKVVDEVRKKYNNLTIHIDCNSAYTLSDIDMFKKIDLYNLKMIEQPLMFDDLIDHAAFQSQIKTPICLDESITSVDKARKAISIKARKWINIKPGRVGVSLMQLLYTIFP
jgi:o-succinylbenzoate synthase